MTATIHHLPPAEPYLTKRELAEHLRCSERTIANRMKDGLPFRRNGAILLFRVSEVDRWMEERQSA